MEAGDDNQESTKSRILSESLRIFADRGYEATTMKDIGAAVGIKAASLYAHYSGKEELFRAVFESALRTWEKLVSGFFARAEGIGDLQEGLGLILGDFACEMMGSVAYRFWARVYVFPPPILGDEDHRRIVAMDRSFAERLAGYCGPRLSAGMEGEDLELLCSSLAFFTMGILMYAEFLDEAAVRKEIGRGVAFHIKSFRNR